LMVEIPLHISPHPASLYSSVVGRATPAAA
jgi:hypothetical protein